MQCLRIPQLVASLHSLVALYERNSLECNNFLKGGYSSFLHHHPTKELGQFRIDSGTHNDLRSIELRKSLRFGHTSMGSDRLLVLSSVGKSISGAE